MFCEVGHSPKSAHIIYPRASVRPLEPEVPSHFSADFAEAVAVLQLSPKASAALSRRLLQRLLHETFGIAGRDLAVEIQTLIDSAKLPPDLADAVDAVRNIGNFAAHPIKFQHTGEICDVEPCEADWSLDVIEALFDFAFVQPERLKQKKAQLDAKLASLGKPPMKQA